MDRKPSLSTTFMFIVFKYDNRPLYMYIGGGEGVKVGTKQRKYKKTCALICFLACKHKNMLVPYHHCTDRYYMYMYIYWSSIKTLEGSNPRPLNRAVVTMSRKHGTTTLYWSDST